MFYSFLKHKEKCAELVDQINLGLVDFYRAGSNPVFSK